VLVVLSDQETELVEHSLLRIPHREELEKRGVHFRQAVCAAPQCSPSRATLMTGLYPHQADVVTNVDSGSLGHPLSPRVPTLGRVFQDNGYSTGYLGKWHLGNDARGLEAFGFSGYRPLDGDALAEAAARWITEQPSQPWLLVTSFLNPHNIYDVLARLTPNDGRASSPRSGSGLRPDLRVRTGASLPNNFDDDLRMKPRPQFEYLTKDQGKPTLPWGKEEWLRYRSYYLDLIEKVDTQMGVILEAIKQRGEQEKTIVVYSSDHGDMEGAHRLPFKGPFMYDELLRVPLTLSYPPLFSRPLVSDALVSSVDIVPTLIDLAGIRWPQPLSGRSLARLVGPHPQELHRAVYAEYYAKQHWVNPIRTIRTTDWKFNDYVKPGSDLATEMYDLRQDPGELHNLAQSSQNQKVEQKLAQDLLGWRRQTGDPLL
jgi:choline-sulfatase